MKAILPCLGLFCAFNVSAADWPQFRGPQASGVDASAPAPTRWDVEAGQNIRWRTPIPGLAHASPIVWNDRVYVATAVRPGKASLKVGLYGDIDSANDQVAHQWRFLALDKAIGASLDKFSAQPTLQDRFNTMILGATPPAETKKPTVGPAKLPAKSKANTPSG